MYGLLAVLVISLRGVEKRVGVECKYIKFWEQMLIGVLAAHNYWEW